MSLNRSELQKLTRLRLQEARILLQKKKPAGAYYLAGYAVECALKACIAKRTRKHDFPNKKAVVDSHVHNLEKLLNLAGLTLRLPNASAALQANWSTVKDWNEGKRYDHDVPLQTAKDLYSAITARKNGVMTWIRQDW